MRHDTTDLLMMAVAKTPDDDLPRLVMADHLDEAGQEEWAAFVRTHLAIARGQLDRKNREKNLTDVFRRAVPKVFQMEKFLSTSVRLGSPFRHTFEFKLKDFDRGFPAVAHCTEQEWLDYGPNLVKLCPITRVVIDNRWAEEDNESDLPFGFAMGEPPGHNYGWRISQELWKRLSGHKPSGWQERGGTGWVCSFKTQQEAADALSEACLGYARDLAFPPEG